MQARELKEGDVVQLSPQDCRNPMFGGCMMVVSEPKSWGVQGYVQSLGSDGKSGGLAYYREQWEEMEYVGTAYWVIE